MKVVRRLPGGLIKQIYFICVLEENKQTKLQMGVMLILSLLIVTVNNNFQLRQADSTEQASTWIHHSHCFLCCEIFFKLHEAMG